MITGLIIVFALSALLLGLSYSKGSGTDRDVKLIQNYDDYFRIVYSTNRNLSKDNNKIDFGITNITDKNQDYVIKLVNNEDKEVYYRLDSEEEKTLGKEIIFTSSLSSKGTDGDYVMHSLEILNDNDFSVKLEINVLDESLETYIKESKQVFTDKNGNYRYYGDNVDNYIIVDGNTYRIVGLFDKEVKVVSEPSNLSHYLTTNLYLSEEDYILSYDKHDLKVDELLDNNSWLHDEYSYWLDSEEGNEGKIVDADVGVRTDSKNRLYYQRIVKKVGSDAKVVKGNGSMSNPYEVSYGS